MVQIRAYQVDPGSNPRKHIHVDDATKALLEIIAPELEKHDAWKDGKPYLARASRTDAHYNLGEHPHALIFSNPKDLAVSELAEKLEAALIMAGVLRRTGKAVYNGSVIYNSPPIILLNDEGRDQLTSFIAQAQQKSLGYQRG